MPVWLWISLASLSCPRNRSLHRQLLAPSSLVLLQQQLLGPNTQTTNNLLPEHLDRDESSHQPDRNESSSCRVPFFKYRCVNKSRITSKHRLQEGILNKLLRCQAQLELTLMMCLSDRSTSTGALSDRSTFRLTDARTMDLRHFGGLVVV